VTDYESKLNRRQLELLEQIMSVTRPRTEGLWRERIAALILDYDADFDPKD
jgi:hypothetical protein